MAEELKRQMEDPATYSSLGFEERLGLIIDAEWNRRQRNKLARLIAKAHFSIPSACIEGIEYIPDSPSPSATWHRSWTYPVRRSRAACWRRMQRPA